MFLAKQILLTILKELKLESQERSFVLPRIDKWSKGEQARELRLFLPGLGHPSIRFHDLRATLATIMLSKGVEPIKGRTEILVIHSPTHEKALVIKIHS